MSGGVGRALDEALGEAAADEGDMGAIVQAGLFDADDLDESETGSLDAPSPLSGAIPSARRPRGRPKGAKNRRTEAVTAWLLQQHRHPLSVMMEAYSMTPAELAKAIGIKEPDAYQLLDLFKLQVRMAEAVAPYVAQRQPQAVAVNANVAAFTVGLAGVNLGVSDPARAGSAGDFQQLDGEVLSVSLGVKSDG